MLQELQYGESDLTSGSEFWLSLAFIYSTADDVGQELRENIDVGIQAAAEALDHQHAENHAAEGSVLLDLVADHRGE